MSTISYLLRDLNNLRETHSLFKNDLLELQRNGLPTGTPYQRMKSLETVVEDLEKAIVYKSSEILYVCKSSEVQSFCSTYEESVDEITD